LLDKKIKILFLLSKSLIKKMSKSKKQTLKDKPEKKAKASEDSSPKVAPKKFSEDDEDLEIDLDDDSDADYGKSLDFDDDDDDDDDF